MHHAVTHAVPDAGTHAVPDARAADAGANAFSDTVADASTHIIPDGVPHARAYGIANSISDAVPYARPDASANVLRHGAAGGDAADAFVHRRLLGLLHQQPELLVAARRARGAHDQHALYHAQY